jgi:hypothetical protein
LSAVWWPASNPQNPSQQQLIAGVASLALRQDAALAHRASFDTIPSDRQIVFQNRRWEKYNMKNSEIDSPDLLPNQAMLLEHVKVIERDDVAGHEQAIHVTGQPRKER